MATRQFSRACLTALWQATLIWAVISGPLSTIADAQEATPGTLPDLSLTPTTVADLIREGQAFAENGEHDEAIKRYHAAHELSPIEPATLLSLATSYEALGSHPLATAAWNRALLSVATNRESGRHARKVAKDYMAQAQILFAAAANRIVDHAATNGLGPESLRHLLPLWAYLENPDAGEQMLLLVPPEERVQTAQRLAIAMASIGDIDRAVALVLTLPDDESRNKTLLKLAQTALDTGNIATAEKIADNITEDRNKDAILAAVAFMNVLTNSRQEPALEIENPVGGTAISIALARHASEKTAPPESLLVAVNDLDDQTARDHAMIGLVRTHLAAGSTLTAISIAKNLDRAPLRYRAYHYIAQHQGDVGKSQLFLWTAIALDAEHVPSLSELNDHIDAIDQGQSLKDVDAASKVAVTLSQQWSLQNHPR